MRHQSVAGAEAPGLRAALGVLLAQLRSAAVNGAVPESAFVEHVQALGLGGAERERLRGELARLGLPVREAHVHNDADSPDMEKVAPFRGENVFPGADVVRALLLRYADPDGFVTSRAVDGVARLAGLGERGRAALRAGAKVRDAEAVSDETEEPGDPGDPGALGKPGRAMRTIRRLPGSRNLRLSAATVMRPWPRRWPSCRKTASADARETGF